MSAWKQIKDLKIGEDIYDELYNKILEDDKEQDEYDIDDFEEFLLYNGNLENSLCLLSEGNKYYIDGVVNEWDDIIYMLDNCNLLDDIEPKDMTKRKITDLFLYQVCVDVISDYVEELNNKKEEEQEEEKRVKKYNDFKEEVDENNYEIGLINGETLKIMAMGEYFNKYKIDEEECYEIKFYKSKEKNEDKIKSCMTDIYFKIEDLSDKIHYVYYNTSSRFAMELSNIDFQEEDD